MRLVQSDRPEPSGMEALLRGTLTADANGCVQVKADTSTVTPVWPRGYSVRGDAGSFEILDATNAVVARSGLVLTIRGGSADPVGDAWTERGCISAGAPWLVGGVRPA